MKFSISAETLVDIVGLSCGFWAGVSVGFCSSPCDLLCAISLQLIGNSTDFFSHPFLFPFSPHQHHRCLASGGFKLAPLHGGCELGCFLTGSEAFF